MWKTPLGWETMGPSPENQAQRNISSYKRSCWISSYSCRTHLHPTYSWISSLWILATATSEPPKSISGLYFWPCSPSEVLTLVVDDDNLPVMDDSLPDLSLDVSRFRESGNGAYQGSKRERHAFIILVIINTALTANSSKVKTKIPMTGLLLFC